MNYSFDKVVNRRNPLESPLKYNGKYEMNFAKFKKFHTKTTQKIIIIEIITIPVL